MSFADPQSVTITGLGTVSLPRTSQDGDDSTYTSSDGLVELLTAHQQGKRTRRTIRINTSKMTADPFKPSENVKVSMSAYVVFDLPPAGYTATEAKAVWDGFAANLAATSGVNITKLLAGEN